METKFIEGTNEQYSIREDGNVISHFLKTRGVNSYRDKVLPVYNHNNCFIYINGKKKTVSIKLLLFKYFNFITCYKCNSKSYDYLEFPRNYVCKKCIKKRLNDEDAQKVKTIPKHYAAGRMTIPTSLLTDELYQNYRTTLLVKRKLAEKLTIKPAYL